MTPTTYFTLASILLTLIVFRLIFFKTVQDRVKQGQHDSSTQINWPFWKHSLNHWLWKGYMIVYALLISWIVLGVFSSLWYVHLPGLLLFVVLEELCAYFSEHAKSKWMNYIFTIYTAVFLLAGIVAQCIWLS